MKRVALYSAVLWSLFAPPAIAGVPEINVKAVCAARMAEAKLTRSPPDQGNADCVRDEEAAKQQLRALWASTSVSIQKRCQSEAHSLGMAGFIDLLVCTQLAKDLESGHRTERGKK